MCRHLTYETALKERIGILQHTCALLWLWQLCITAWSLRVMLEIKPEIFPLFKTNLVTYGGPVSDSGLYHVRRILRVKSAFHIDFLQGFVFAELCLYKDRHVCHHATQMDHMLDLERQEFVNHRHTSQMIHEDEDLPCLGTDLLQGNNVAFVQVQLGGTQLLPQIADHLLVYQYFFILAREHSLHVRKDHVSKK